MWSSSVALSRRDYICSWIFIQVLGFPGRRARGPDLRIGGVWRRGRSPGCAPCARNMFVGAPLGRDEALPVTTHAPQCPTSGRRGSVESEVFYPFTRGRDGGSQDAGGPGFVLQGFLPGHLV